MQLQIFPSWSAGEQGREWLIDAFQRLRDCYFRAAAQSRATRTCLFDNYRLHEKRSLAKSVCRIKKDLVPFFGHLRAADLMTRHIKAYKIKRRDEGLANATINRELELLQRAYRLGYEQNHRWCCVFPRSKGSWSTTVT